MQTHEFTQDDFQKFHTAILIWMQRLGMTDWHVTVTHDQIGSGICAQTQYNTMSKGVSFRLTKNTEGDYNMIRDPEVLALHEVIHLLLADYCETTAKLQDSHHDLVVGREHEVIHKLMKVLK